MPAGLQRFWKSPEFSPNFRLLNTIIYALWDEEEIDLFGSVHFAMQASQTGENIRGVINVDILGWDGNNDWQMDIHTRPIANSLELVNLVKNLNNDYQIGLAPVIYNPDTKRSDHASFWNQGYSAALLGEAFIGGGEGNPFYHTSNDKIEHFNLDYFRDLSKLAVATISHLSLNSIPVAVTTREEVSVPGFVLNQNYPNPFNASTTIEFAVPKPGNFTLKFYNALGKEVATQVAEHRSAGTQRFNWEARGLASGVYLYRLEAVDFVQSKKLILMQ